MEKFGLLFEANFSGLAALSGSPDLIVNCNLVKKN